MVCSNIPPPSSTNNAAELNTTELLPDFINNATNGRPVNVLVFSEDGNYLAEHFSDTGELGMHFRLRYTSELVSRQIVGEPLPVYSMVFSHDKELLAVAGTDGTIRIWSSFTGKLVRELKQYPESRVPIHFISDTYNVLVASSPWELVVLDPLGAELSKIQAKSSILNVAITSDKKHVAVLTEENRLELYDLGTGEYVGYVPSFNVTAMTSFDFNHDDSQLLMGHQDGSVYMVDVKKVLTVPRKKPVLRLITEEEVVEKGVEFTDRIPLVEYKDSVVDGGHVRHIPEDVFTSPRHSIDMLVGTTFLPDPFTLSLDAQLGYSNSFLLHPFSFGLSWRSSWGFPEAPFPYIYHHGAIEYDPPLLISWVLEVPLGLSFSPWGSGLEIHTEVALGFAVHELWNRRMGAQAVTAGIHSKDFHGSFVTALTMGVAWKGITLKFSGEWDSELGWTGQVVLGYSFNLPVPQKYRRENSLQKVAVEPERNDVAEMEMLP